MTKIGTFFEESEVKTYEVEEGPMTYRKGINPNNGLPNEQVTFEKQVDEENFLVQGTGERSMKLAEAGGIATHFNPYDPEVNGSLPKANAAAGAYPKRYVGAAKLTSRELQLPLAPDNVEIKAGDKLEIKDPKKGLDKSAATTNVVTSFDNIPANTGGYVTVDCDGPIRVKAAG